MSDQTYLIFRNIQSCLQLQLWNIFWMMMAGLFPANYFQEKHIERWVRRVINNLIKIWCYDISWLYEGHMYIYSPQIISKKSKLKGGWGGRGIITTSPTLLLPALHPIFPPRLPTKIPKEIFLPPTNGISLFVATQANSVSGFKAGGVVTKIQSVDIFKIEPIEAKDCEIIQCQIGKEIEENLPNLKSLRMEKMRESQIF